MILKLEGEINDDMLDKLIDAYNILPDGDNIDIYFSSMGGDERIMSVILHLINLNCDKTVLYAYDTIASSAFELFFMVNCKKQYIGGVIGMYHMASASLDYNENGQPKTKYDFVVCDYLKYYCRENTVKLCDFLKLTESENNEIFSNEGIQLWFTTERMNEFLEIAQKNKFI